MHPTSCVKSTAAVVALGMLMSTSPLRAEELAPGEILSRQNWQQAKDLMPPEILRHYELGEYANPIVRLDNGAQHWSKGFVEATQRNATTLALDEKGAIVEKATGKKPPYIQGFPFPSVTAEDPQAGLKILWNTYADVWNNGSFHNNVQIHWVSTKGLERSATEEVYYLYYQGQPQQYIPAQNPGDLLVQFLSTTVEPADLNGTTALNWRYRASEKRDSVWAFVPALRRVRAVSPTNRSDGFLGSDMSEDDGPFFDGKLEDFTWKLVGEQDVLRLVDPFNLRNECKDRALPDGGWRGIFQHVPAVGFQDPNWKGLPWAPMNFALARRRCWIVEGTPKDPYYLYGKIQLYIDKEIYQGAYNRKFNWQGELVNTYTVFAALNATHGGGDDYYANGCVVYQGAENLKANRATVVTPPPLEGKEPPNDRRIKPDPHFFSSDSLVRFGK
jgi:hypothetical protein